MPATRSKSSGSSSMAVNAAAGPSIGGPLLRQKRQRPRSPPPAHAPVFSQMDTLRLVNARRHMGYGTDLYYQEHFLNTGEASRWYDQLVDLDAWYHPNLTIYGRTFPQSREIAAYATTQLRVRYSGADITVHSPFPPEVEAMRLRVQDVLGVEFNHALLNRYADGSVYIGQHSDTRDNGVIACVSLGAERTWVMTPRLPPKNGGGAAVVPSAEAGALAKRNKEQWTLRNGSLLVMQGTTQDFWKHEIPRDPKVLEPRISLTFRQL